MGKMCNNRLPEMGNVNTNNMLPEKIYKYSIFIAVLLLICIIMALSVRRCSAQSIGMNFSVSMDTCYQYGISFDEVIGCAGIYANVITKEDQQYDRTNCNLVKEFTGIIGGINYSLHNGHLRSVTAGAGVLTSCELDKYGSKTNAVTTRRFIAETGADIMLWRWLDLTVRINSIPQVSTGLKINLSF